MNIRKLFLLAVLVGFNVGLAMMVLSASQQRRAAANTTSAARQDVLKTAVVPFELLPSNHMVVRAKLNGKGPYRLVFDLGAPITLISNSAAESSGAIDAKTPKSILFSMRGEGKVKALEVGDLSAKDLPVVVFDHPALKALGSFFSGPLDGIIGFTFFARYKTTIDYKAKEMTFTPVDFEIRDLMKDLPKQLSGPRTARERILAPTGLWGLRLGEPLEDGSGVRISAVLAGSPAAEGGLKTGDALLGIDGRWTTSAADALDASRTLEAGKPVEVEIRREEETLRLSVTPRDGV
jgi:membrane-associated protease RseP (regulator of RpoE activity)